MATNRNPEIIRDLPTQNCLGYITVATKDGQYVSYTKEASGYNIIAFDFTAAEGSTAGKSVARTWVTLNNKQFDPQSDSSEFADWQKNNFDRWFLAGGRSKFAVLEFLSEGDPSWIGKLEEHYDSGTGTTDMQSVARDIASHIDGKLIGYQLVQRRDKTDEYDEAGKRIYKKVEEYVVGDKFFDPNGKPPKDGLNTFIPF